MAYDCTFPYKSTTKQDGYGNAAGILEAVRVFNDQDKCQRCDWLDGGDLLEFDGLGVMHTGGIISRFFVGFDLLCIAVILTLLCWIGYRHSPSGLCWYGVAQFELWE